MNDDAFRLQTRIFLPENYYSIFLYVNYAYAMTLFYADVPFRKAVDSFKFSLNTFIEFAEFSEQIFTTRVRGFQPATSCVRDGDATAAPSRHM